MIFDIYAVRLCASRWHDYPPILCERADIEGAGHWSEGPLFEHLSESEGRHRLAARTAMRGNAVEANHQRL